MLQPKAKISAGRRGFKRLLDGMPRRRKSWLAACFAVLSGVAILSFTSRPARELSGSPATDKPADNPNTLKPPATAHPDAMGLNEWKELLHSNPDSKELWELELNRVDRLSVQVTKSGIGSASDWINLQITAASNLQQKGIALRHLNKHVEAIAEFEKAVQLLSAVKARKDCINSQQVLTCAELGQMLSLTLSLIGDDYIALADIGNAEKHLTLAVRAAQDSEEYEKRLDHLVDWYLTRGEFNKAVDVVLKEIEEAIAARADARKEAASRVAESAYSALFNSISWDPTTGLLRERDPRDFADVFGVDAGRANKYGMSNPDEDSATFLGIMLVHSLIEKRLYSFGESGTNEESREELLRKYDVERYVRGQLAEGNFEPAAKFLYLTHVNKHFYSNGNRALTCPDAPGAHLMFAEVESGLLRSPSLVVSAWTVNVIELLHRGELFLEKHCVKEANPNGDKRQETP